MDTWHYRHVAEVGIFRVTGTPLTERVRGALWARREAGLLGGALCECVLARRQACLLNASEGGGCSLCPRPPQGGLIERVRGGEGTLCGHAARRAYIRIFLSLVPTERDVQRNARYYE